MQYWKQDYRTWMVNEWVDALLRVHYVCELITYLDDGEPVEVFEREYRPPMDSTPYWRLACKLVRHLVNKRGVPYHPSVVLAGFPADRPDVDPIYPLPPHLAHLRERKNTR